MVISKGVRFMLLAIICFACMNVLVKFLNHIPATELVFFRALISLVLCVFMLKKQQISVWGTNRPILLLRGVFGTSALILFFLTLQNMRLDTAITLHYLTPIFATIFASVFLGEKSRFIQYIYFLVSFVGIVIIKGFDSEASLEYMIYGVLAACLSGAAYTCIRKLKKSEHSLVIIFYFPLVTLPITGIISLFHWQTPKGLDWLWILLIGLLTQAGQYLMTKAYQTEHVSKVANISYTGIIYALFFSVFLFKEDFKLSVYIGIAVVFLGVLLNMMTKTNSK